MILERCDYFGFDFAARRLERFFDSLLALVHCLHQLFDCFFERRFLSFNGFVVFVDWAIKEYDKAVEGQKTSFKETVEKLVKAMDQSQKTIEKALQTSGGEIESKIVTPFKNHLKDLATRRE